MTAPWLREVPESGRATLSPADRARVEGIATYFRASVDWRPSRRERESVALMAEAARLMGGAR